MAAGGVSRRMGVVYAGDWGAGVRARSFPDPCRRNAKSRRDQPSGSVRLTCCEGYAGSGFTLICSAAILLVRASITACSSFLRLS